MLLKNQLLKQARKRMGLSVKQMAYLIGTNPSNLSKNERGKRAISKEVMLGYLAVTGEPWTKLFPKRTNALIEAISERAINLIEDLEALAKTDLKAKRTIQILNDVLGNMSCLKDVTQKDHEKEN